jgi:hypothetical protein
MIETLSTVSVLGGRDVSGGALAELRVGFAKAKVLCMHGLTVIIHTYSVAVWRFAPDDTVSSTLKRQILVHGKQTKFNHNYCPTTILYYKYYYSSYK